MKYTEEEVIEMTKDMEPGKKRQNRRFYLRNVDVIKDKNHKEITCDCGSSMKKGSLLSHLRSKKHIAFVQRGIKNPSMDTILEESSSSSSSSVDEFVKIIL